MAAISLRNGVYQARIRQKGFPTVCRSFLLKKDALNWSRQLTADMQGGRYTVPSKAKKVWTLDALLGLYVTQVTPTKKGAVQEKQLIRLLRGEEVCRVMCAKPIEELRPSDVAAMRDQWLNKGLAPSTVRIRLALLSHVLEVARRELEIEVANVVRAVRKPRASNERSRVFFDGEADRIIKATRSHDLPLILTLCLQTGMRRSEVCDLVWERVDLPRRVITLRTSKNSAPRLVPLSPLACAVLRDHPKREDGRVFGLKARCASSAFADAVRRAREMYEDECSRFGAPVDDAYLRDLHLHDARHHCLTELAERGWDVTDIAAVSGHRSWACLRRYVHAKASRLADKLSTEAMVRPAPDSGSDIEKRTD